MTQLLTVVTRPRLVTIVVFVLCLYSTTMQLGRPAPALAQADPASDLFGLINQVRAEHGLAPFQFNARLASAAQVQASYNAANTTYGHTGEGGSRPQDRANAAGYSGFVVENVVGGTDLSPQQGVTWWINSPVHFNTLISTRYVEAGTGYARGGRQNQYVLVVGRPSDQPVTAPSAPATVDQPAIVVPIVLSQPREDGSIVHVVRTGHTLWAIAARYGVRLTDLLLYNQLTVDAFIRPGQELLIRLADGQMPPPTPTPPLSHIVREGETLWTIAATYRLELYTLLWLNSLTEDAILQPGDELTVRLAPGQAPPPTPTPRLTHVVAAGESLWSIAANYGLSVETLMELNALESSSVLQPGDEVKIRGVPTPQATPNTVEPGEALAASSKETLTTPVGSEPPAPGVPQARSSPAASVQAQPAPPPAVVSTQSASGVSGTDVSILVVAALIAAVAISAAAFVIFASVKRLP